VKKLNRQVIGLIIFTVFFQARAFGQGSSSIEEQPKTLIVKIQELIRPYALKVLGEETTTRWFGESWTSELELPAIPEIIRDARSSVQRQALNENTLPQEVWRSYNVRFVTELYEATRRLKANSNDLAKWMNVLDQGGSQEGVYRALVLDQTYAGLENYPEPMNEAMIKFSESFSKKYLNRERTVEQLTGVNFFSIKRILVENSLEVLDALAKENSDNVYRWYAYFSGEMAYLYPNAFLDEIRLNKSMLRHYDWAQKSPEQLLKAELITKLHLIMNHIQGSP